MVEEKAPAVERWGILRLLWGILVRPRATLSHLCEHEVRTWWVPAFLAVLLVVLPILVSAPISVEHAREALLVTQEQLEERQGMELSAEQQAQMESMATSPLIIVVFPAILRVVGQIVSWLAWAGALYLAGIALGGRSTFGQMFRVVVWTWLPYALRGSLQTVFILLSGQLIANPGLSGLVQDSRPTRPGPDAPRGPAIQGGYLSVLEPDSAGDRREHSHPLAPAQGHTGYVGRVDIAGGLESDPHTRQRPLCPTGRRLLRRFQFSGSGDGSP